MRNDPNLAVMAVDLCYMYCLQREDLEAVIELWPELRVELDRMGESSCNRIAKTLKN